MQFRDAIEQDACDLQTLAERAAQATGHAFWLPAIDGTDYPGQERSLDAAALALRQSWLELAHRPADRTLKSPREGDTTRVACGERVRFGYEREIDVSMLEQRGVEYVQSAPGWNSEVVLFRSGQAALACLLQFAITHWGRGAALAVAHAGAYFETASLLKSWPQRVLYQVPLQHESLDLAIGEPVWCDGAFGCTPHMPPVRHALILDTTMSGPGCDLGPTLRQAKCPLVIAYSSGLKLDQAGLELANVGIVRIYARDGCASVSDGLREIRALVGAGLTLDELSALSAPWFMDRAYADRYVAAVFAHNQDLAHAIGTDSTVFAPHCHPSLTDSGCEAPFCALTLRDPSIEAYRALEARIADEAQRRDLLLTKGGSFGFRGHRFELIEPPPEQGAPFLRIAMGWRGGWSCEGLIELLRDLAHPVRANRKAARASST
jgi:hypothetical protein